MAGLLGMLENSISGGAEFLNYSFQPWKTGWNLVPKTVEFFEKMEKGKEKSGATIYHW